MSRNSWIGLIIFIIVAVAALIVIGVGTSGFTDWAFTRFFPKAAEETAALAARIRG